MSIVDRKCIVEGCFHFADPKYDCCLHHVRNQCIEFTDTEKAKYRRELNGTEARRAGVNEALKRGKP